MLVTSIVTEQCTGDRDVFGSKIVHWLQSAHDKWSTPLFGMGRVEPDRSVIYAVVLHKRLFNSSTLYPEKP